MKETVVVEGPRDVAAVNAAGSYRLLMTHGFSLSNDTKRAVMRAARGRGLILFTDPDAAGVTIREALVAVVGSCKHAYLRVEEATRGDNIGVENASPEAIREALSMARTWRSDPPRLYHQADLGQYGLTDPARVHAVCEVLRIGHGPPDRLASRLNRFGIRPVELVEALGVLG